MLALKFRVWLPDFDQMLRVKALVFEKDKTRCVCGYSFDFYLEDENATIMQSTGLKDKNDKEIFEGDIITDGHTLGVLRNHQTLGFYMVDEKGKENFLSDTVDTEGFEEAKEFMKNTIEIIGNIYETPELLEDKE